MKCSGEGPVAAIRNRERPGPRHRAVSGRRAGRGPAAVGWLQAAEIRPSQPGPGSRRQPGSPRTRGRSYRDDGRADRGPRPARRGSPRRTASRCRPATGRKRPAARGRRIHTRRTGKRAQPARPRSSRARPSNRPNRHSSEATACAWRPRHRTSARPIPAWRSYLGSRESAGIHITSPTLPCTTRPAICASGGRLIRASMAPRVFASVRMLVKPSFSAPAGPR